MEGYAQPRDCGIYLAVLGQVGQIWKKFFFKKPTRP